MINLDSEFHWPIIAYSKLSSKTTFYWFFIFKYCFVFIINTTGSRRFQTQIFIPTGRIILLLAK